MAAAGRSRVGVCAASLRASQSGVPTPHEAESDALDMERLLSSQRAALEHMAEDQRALDRSLSQLKGTLETNARVPADA